MTHTNSKAWVAERIRLADYNRANGIKDALNDCVDSMVSLGKKKKLRKSQKRAIKKLAEKANKEFV